MTMRLLVLPLLCATLPAATERWSFSCAGGTSSCTGKVHISVEASTITFETKKAPPVRVEGQAVLKVETLRTNTRHPVASNTSAVYGGLVSMSPYTLFFTPFFLPFWVSGAVMAKHEIFVQVEWADSTGAGSLILVVPDKSYSPFIKAMSSATGRKWFDMREQWTRLENLAKTKSSAAALIWIDSPSRFQDLTLEPGIYRVVAFETSDGRAHVAIFSGTKSDHQQLLAAGPAQLEWSSGVSQPKLVYSNGTRVSQIILPGMRLVIE